jgi:hypothetical protein
MHSVLSIPLLLAGLHILGYLTYLAISLHRLVAPGAKSAELLLVTFWSYTALLVVLLIYLGFLFCVAVDICRRRAHAVVWNDWPLFRAQSVSRFF